MRQIHGAKNSLHNSTTKSLINKNDVPQIMLNPSNAPYNFPILTPLPLSFFERRKNVYKDYITIYRDKHSNFIHEKHRAKNI